MKKLKAILISVLCFGFALSFAGCDKKDNPQPEEKKEEQVEDVDYVAKTKLDQEVTESSSFFGADGIAYATVVRCVDGDTADFLTGGVEFRARFLGVDTPESTGDVQVWGKTASLFTANKLNNAYKVVVQTNGGPAQKDTTGSRYLTYVWYQPTEGADFRLINLELVQEGLSYGKSSTASRYADVLTLAQVQAVRNKLRIFGDDIDENFYYGDALKTTIKEIYENIDELVEKHVKVKFDCVVARTNGQDVYVQEYDAETDDVYSIMLYTGFNLNTNKLNEGYNVSVCGVISLYNGLPQISGMVDIRGNSDSLKVYSVGNEIIVTPITPAELNEELTYSSLRKLVKLDNIVVESVYTTNNGGSSDGAMTITGKVNGQTVTVRTDVLYDANKDLVTASYVENKTINVIGLLEEYNNKTQIKVINVNDITIVE